MPPYTHYVCTPYRVLSRLKITNFVQAFRLTHFHRNEFFFFFFWCSSLLFFLILASLKLFRTYIILVRTFYQHNTCAAYELRFQHFIFASSLLIWPNLRRLRFRILPPDEVNVCSFYWDKKKGKNIFISTKNTNFSYTGKWWYVVCLWGVFLS